MGIMRKIDPGILVVNDNRALTDTLVEFLRKLGYRALPAYDGKEGLTNFEQGDFQIVITDFNMPKMDGMELLEAIVKQDSDVNVIMLTGVGSIESAVQAIKCGAYDYITKPLQLEEIELIVNRALEKHANLRKMRMFRQMFLFVLFSIPFWILFGILLISAWR